VIGLFRSELLRLTSRRLARLAALALLGILLLVQVIAAGRSHEPTAEQQSTIAVVRAQEAEFRKECEAQKDSGEFPSYFDCSGDFGANDPRYRSEDVLEAVAGGVAVGAAVLAFIVGASYIGADWMNGTLQSLLFWEPRRGRVVLAKAAALVTVLVAFTAFAQGVGWLTTMLVAATRGTTEDTTFGVQMSAFLTMLRGMVVVSFTGLLGFAFAGLARYTGAALGAGFVYFVFVENVIRALRPRWVAYVISTNVSAVMTKRVDLEQYTDETVTGVIGSVRGAFTLALYLVLLVGAFYAVFSQRDVT
jgi:hypothetical protein